MRGSNTNTSELCFPLLLTPRSLSGHTGSLGTGRTEGGSMWAVMPSEAFSERIKGGQWRWGGSEGAVNPGPTPLPSFREREEREWERGPLVREAQSHFTLFHSAAIPVSSGCGEQVEIRPMYQLAFLHILDITTSEMDMTHHYTGCLWESLVCV